MISSMHEKTKAENLLVDNGYKAYFIHKFIVTIETVRTQGEKYVFES